MPWEVTIHWLTSESWHSQTGVIGNDRRGGTEGGAGAHRVTATSSDSGAGSRRTTRGPVGLGPGTVDIEVRVDGADRLQRPNRLGPHRAIQAPSSWAGEREHRTVDSSNHAETYAAGLSTGCSSRSRGLRDAVRQVERARAAGRRPGRRSRSAGARRPRPPVGQPTGQAAARQSRGRAGASAGTPPRPSAPAPSARRRRSPRPRATAPRSRRPVIRQRRSGPAPGRPPASRATSDTPSDSDTRRVRLVDDHRPGTVRVPVGRPPGRSVHRPHLRPRVRGDGRRVERRVLDVVAHRHDVLLAPSARRPSARRSGRAGTRRATGRARCSGSP